jgi:predicted GIY-YIG superfamily endonuclease
MKKAHKVYGIYLEGMMVYCGMSNSLIRRSFEHNRDINKATSRAYDKDLYGYLRSKGINSVVLVELFSFNKRVDAKRKEMQIILEDYFGAKLLKQKVPNISDFR